MKRFKYMTSRCSGFTLIEMMIVIGIIALLAALTLGISNSVLRNSEISRTQNTLRLLDMALQEWELEIGRPVTFRDYASPAEEGGFGQGQGVVYAYDITSWVDLNGTALEDEPLLIEPGFGWEAGVENDIMLEAMATRIKETTTTLLESESSKEILQRILPRHFDEVEIATDDGIVEGSFYIDAWGTPIGVVFPCQQFSRAPDPYNLLGIWRDESGDLTLRDQAEDGLGSCVGLRPYFVSAGPDRLWGYRYQSADGPDHDNPEAPSVELWSESLDNIYSYDPFLVKESR